MKKFTLVSLIVFFAFANSQPVFLKDCDKSGSECMETWKMLLEQVNKMNDCDGSKHCLTMCRGKPSLKAIEQKSGIILFIGPVEEFFVNGAHEHKLMVASLDKATGTFKHKLKENKQHGGHHHKK